MATVRDVWRQHRTTRRAHANPSSVRHLLARVPGAVLAAWTFAGPLAHARHAAWEYWHATPCGGHYRVLARRLPRPDIGRASWRDVRGVRTGCTITLTTGLPRTTLCQVVVHEVGHLLGYRERGGYDHGSHSRNPRNVMFPYATWLNVPAACRPRRLTDRTPAGRV